MHLLVVKTLLLVIKTYKRKKKSWTSLVVQWIRICLPMQGTGVQSMVWEDPTFLRATKPKSHNYRAAL